MPELAEVEFYRKCWDPGLGGEITGVHLHRGKRIFRGLPVERLAAALRGAVFLGSAARGKQILFRFTNDLWLGMHLGLTGTLRAEIPHFKPSKHDHFALFQKDRALVFNDPRLFGRVLFFQGALEPHWWARLPPGLVSKWFTRDRMTAFLQRHRKLPVKAALLLQDGFPGIGNWMADEILWRAGIHPRTASGALRQREFHTLWTRVRFVCHGAIKHISKDLSDPPAGWLFNERWHKHGRCPADNTRLLRAAIGGRTTVWCPRCQRAAPPRHP